MRKTKEIEVKILYRLRKHGNDPRFVALRERLEQLRDKHLQGQLTSIEFLRSLLELARDVVVAERQIVPAEEMGCGKAALTELFERSGTLRLRSSWRGLATTSTTSFGSSDSTDGSRQRRASAKFSVRSARRFSYKLHRDQELFEKAYGYIKQHY